MVMSITNGFDRHGIHRRRRDAPGSREQKWSKTVDVP